jgi:hypothetical protein
MHKHVLFDRKRLELLIADIATSKADKPFHGLVTVVLESNAERIPSSANYVGIRAHRQEKSNHLWPVETSSVM